MRFLWHWLGEVRGGQEINKKKKENRRSVLWQHRAIREQPLWVTFKATCCNLISQNNRLFPPLLVISEECTALKIKQPFLLVSRNRCPPAAQITSSKQRSQQKAERGSYSKWSGSSCRAWFLPHEGINPPLCSEVKKNKSNRWESALYSQVMEIHHRFKIYITRRGPKQYSSEEEGFTSQTTGSLVISTSTQILQQSSILVSFAYNKITI